MTNFRWRGAQTDGEEEFNFFTSMTDILVNNLLFAILSISLNYYPFGTKTNLKRHLSTSNRDPKMNERWAGIKSLRNSIISTAIFTFDNFFFWHLNATLSYNNNNSTSLFDFCSAHEWQNINIKFLINPPRKPIANINRNRNVTLQIITISVDISAVLVTFEEL